MLNSTIFFRLNTTEISCSKVSVHTVKIHFLHMRFVHDSLSHHECCRLCDLTKGKIELLERRNRAEHCDQAAEREDTHRYKRLDFDGELTLRIGSPSLSTATRAMAPSERTRQSPKLITCTFLRCLRAYT